MAIGGKKSRNTVLFENYSNGLKTNRDSWTYNYSKSLLQNNVSSTFDYYNEELKRYLLSDDSKNEPESLKEKDKFIGMIDKMLAKKEKTGKENSGKRNQLKRLYRNYWIYLCRTNLIE